VNAQADERPLDLRIEVGALAVTEDAVAVFEQALQPDTTADDWLRRVRQRGLEGALLATRASTALQFVGALRAGPDDEAVLSDEEIELLQLLGVIQTLGDDLVELDACVGDLPDFGEATGRMAPMLMRVRELVARVMAGLEGEAE
jgi:hypothetical protein